LLGSVQGQGQHMVCDRTLNGLVGFHDQLDVNGWSGRVARWTAGQKQIALLPLLETT
jgi:hypothetical protein